jgi:4-alpha-glucanotransferase
MNLEQLHELAALYRLESSYYDGLGTHRQPSPDTILRVLESLGAPVSAAGGLEEALLRRRAEAARPMEPVAVKWGQSPLELVLTLPSPWPEGRLGVEVSLEEGGTRSYDFAPSELEEAGWHEVEGRWYEGRRLRIGDDLPFGYHALRLEGGGVVEDALVIAAPGRAFARRSERSWGLFSPLYALRDRRSWGAGDLSDLRRFIDWTGGSGGNLVGTLPLFAAFLDEPYAPSPYMPVSRLFWNEFYLDPTRAPGWAECREARKLVASPAFQRNLKVQRSLEMVDYRSEMRLKRRVLEYLKDHVFASPALVKALETFERERPEVLTYARFRALAERSPVGWRSWPERLVADDPREEDLDPGSVNYHRFVQWATQGQVDDLLAFARAKEVGLYLDLPLGVHPDGFDVWCHRESFASDVSGGSPPDGFFTGGQDWGFPPLHPERERERGYPYLRATLRHLMRHCDLVRIDHAMSLQRLFWIPHGAPATDGVYVYYPTQELFALVALESHRQQCVVVGEDLGTVTPEVRESMDERGIYRMYVGQFEFSLDGPDPLHPVPRRVVAGLNTHDTPTAAGFWHGDDVDLRVELGLLDPEQAERERDGRRTVIDALLRHFGEDGDPEDARARFAALRKWLGFLAESEAEYVLVSLEDLLCERRPQNVPGTAEERPNWRRKTARSFDDYSRDPDLLEVLRELDRKRRWRKLGGRS